MEKQTTSKSWKCISKDEATATQTASKAHHPVGRTNIAATRQGDTLYALGGNTGSFDRHLSNELWSYDLKSHTWKQLAPLESGVFRTNLTYDPVTHALYSFGGGHHGKEFGTLIFSNQIHAYDIKSNTWSVVHPSDPKQPVPDPRSWHVAAITPNKDNSHSTLYIFGGIGDKQMYGDFWKFDIQEKHWTLINSEGPTTPLKRAQSSFSYDSKHRNLYLYAGIQFFGTNGLLNDVWKYNIDNSTWEKVLESAKVAGNPPLMSGHAALYSADHDTLTVYGGNEMDGKYLSDTWELDLKAKHWKKVETHGEKVDQRTGHGYVEYLGDLVVFGGFSDLLGIGPKVKNDVWIYHP